MLSSQTVCVLKPLHLPSPVIFDLDRNFLNLIKSKLVLGSIVQLCRPRALVCRNRRPEIQKANALKGQWYVFVRN
jgi:hypothetical protein